MIKTTIVFILSLVLLGIVAYVFVPNRINRLKPKASIDKIIAVYIKKDSSRQLDILWRQINVDSFKSDDKYVYRIDTLWGYPEYKPITDSLGRPKLDSITKVPLYSASILGYKLINKDSVNWRIEGIPLGKLLSK